MKAPLILLGTAIEKGVHVIALLSLFFWIHPGFVAHAASAQPQEVNTGLVFHIEPKPNSPQTQAALTFLSIEEVLKNDPLTTHVQAFLAERGSPMAPCVVTLLQQESWKKILSLANAESALGKRTIPRTYNYWGVMQGRTLKKMGNNPCEAIVNMQRFLGEYPRNSAVKYKDMPYDCGPSKKQRCMNGFYKQPYALHWTTNNMVIVNQLEALEARAHQDRIALAHQTGLDAAAQELELVK